MKNLSLVVILITAGCAHTIEREGRKLTMKEAYEYDMKNPLMMVKEGKCREAIPMFQHIISFYQMEVDVSSAVYYAGHCYMKMKNYKEAEEAFKEIIQKYPRSKFTGKACLMLYEISKEKGDYSNAVYYLKNFIEKGSSDKPLYYWKFKLGELYSLAGDPVNSFYSFVEAYLESEEGEFRELSRSLASKLYTYYIPEDKRNTIQFPAGMVEEMEDYREFPKDPHRVGVMLPLSGKLSVIGEHILKGLEMALGIPKGKSEFEIIIEDTGEKETDLLSHFKRLVEEGVCVIVGPPSTIVSKTVASLANSSQTLFVSFSTDESIVENNPFVIRFFPGKKQQAQALAKYAVERLFLQRIAILYPDDIYGRDMVNLFWDAFLNEGGEIRGVEGYMPEQEDFSNEIKKLVGLYYIQEREEFRAGMDPRKIPPVVDFEAIFLPDTIRALSYLLPQLEYFDVDATRLFFLGTYLWDVPEISKIPRKYRDNVLFVTGFNPYSETAEEFVRSFQHLYNEKPNSFSAFAYDFGKLLYKIFKEKSKIKCEKLRDELLSTSEFYGVTGRFKFSPDGNLLPSTSIIKYSEVRP